MDKNPPLKQPNMAAASGDPGPENPKVELANKVASSQKQLLEVASSQAATFPNKEIDRYLESPPSTPQFSASLQTIEQLEEHDNNKELDFSSNIPAAGVHLSNNPPHNNSVSSGFRIKLTGKKFVRVDSSTSSPEVLQVVKKRRGRPPGSKNKVKPSPESSGILPKKQKELSSFTNTTTTERIPDHKAGEVNATYLSSSSSYTGIKVPGSPSPDMADRVLQLAGLPKPKAPDHAHETCQSAANALQVRGTEETETFGPNDLFPLTPQPANPGPSFNAPHGAGRANVWHSYDHAPPSRYANRFPSGGESIDINAPLEPVFGVAESTIGRAEPHLQYGQSLNVQYGQTMSGQPGTNNESTSQAPPKTSPFAFPTGFVPDWIQDEQRERQHQATEAQHAPWMAPPTAAQPQYSNSQFDADFGDVIDSNILDKDYVYAPATTMGGPQNRNHANYKTPGERGVGIDASGRPYAEQSLFSLKPSQNVPTSFEEFNDNFLVNQGEGSTTMRTGSAVPQPEHVSYPQTQLTYTAEQMQPLDEEAAKWDALTEKMKYVVMQCVQEDLSPADMPFALNLLQLRQYQVDRMMRLVAEECAKEARNKERENRIDEEYLVAIMRNPNAEEPVNGMSHPDWEPPIDFVVTRDDIQEGHTYLSRKFPYTARRLNDHLGTKVTPPSFLGDYNAELFSPYDDVFNSNEDRGEPSARNSARNDDMEGEMINEKMAEWAKNFDKSLGQKTLPAYAGGSGDGAFGSEVGPDGQWHRPGSPALAKKDDDDADVTMSEASDHDSDSPTPSVGTAATKADAIIGKMNNSRVTKKAANKRKVNKGKGRM